MFGDLLKTTAGNVCVDTYDPNIINLSTDLSSLQALYDTSEIDTTTFTDPTYGIGWGTNDGVSYRYLYIDVPESSSNTVNLTYTQILSSSALGYLQIIEVDANNTQVGNTIVWLRDSWSSYSSGHDHIVDGVYLLTQSTTPVVNHSIVATLSGQSNTRIRIGMGAHTNAYGHSKCYIKELVFNDYIPNDCTPPSKRTTDGLLAYYPLTGTAEDHYGEGGNESGVEYNGVSFVDDVERDSVASFDGVNDSIGLPIISIGSDSYSFSCWFKTSVNDSTLRTLFDPVDAHGYVVYIRNGKIELTGQGTFNGINIISNTTVSTGVWVHASYIIDNTNGVLTLTVDSLEQTTSFTAGTVIDDFSVTTYIGKIQSNIRYFNGQLSNVRIYNKALTTLEITDLYNEENETTDGLVAHYPLTKEWRANDAWVAYDGAEVGVTYVDDVDRGAVVSFDGVNDYITTTSPIIVKNSSYTITLWANPDNYSGDTKTLIVAGNLGLKSFTVSGGFGFGYIGGASLPVTTDVSVTTRAAKFAQSTAKQVGTNIQFDVLDGWHMYTGTYDGTTMSVYMDGTLIASEAHSSGWAENDYPFQFRSPSYNSSYVVYNKSNISNTRLYNRALTPTEIDTIYNYELTNRYVKVTDGLVAYYPLKKNSDDNWYNQYDGTDSGVTYDGNSAMFDTTVNSRVTTSLSGFASGTNSYTISIWSTLLENTGPYITPIFATNSTNSITQGVQLGIAGSNSLVISRANGSVHESEAVATPIISSFSHLVVTYDGSVMKLYRDSVEVGSLASTISANDGNLYFGCFNTAADTQEFLTAKLSNTRVYNRAITEEEITEIYNLEKGEFE